MMLEISMGCELTWLHLTPGGAHAATRSAARDACARFHQRQWWLWDRWSSQFAQVLADERTNLQGVIALVPWSDVLRFSLLRVEAC